MTEEFGEIVIRSFLPSVMQRAPAADRRPKKKGEAPVGVLP